MNRTLASLAAMVAFASPSVAQIELHEVFFDTGSAGTQWIELHNRSNLAQDLSAWTIHVSLDNPQREHWWGFPAGARIAANGYLRVHWFAPTKPMTATDVYTGTARFHFLFGLGGGRLVGTAGAIGLVATQTSGRIIDPAEWRDYVSWGRGGFRREDIAVRAALWLRGQAVSAPQADDSLALDVRSQSPRRGSDWFPDASPTPLAANHGGARVLSYGLNCSLGAVNPPVIETISLPVPGNRDFGLRVRNTAIGESVALILAASRGTGAVRIGPCSLWVGGGASQALLFPAQNLVTEIPSPLADPALNGGLAYLQAFTYRTQLDYGTSQGLEIEIGRQ